MSDEISSPEGKAEYKNEEEPDSGTFQDSKFERDRKCYKRY